MKINGEFVLREIAGDTILVPVGKTALKINGMITLDPVGNFIWKKIEEGKNRDEILASILDEFEVEEAVAAPDLDEFLGKMKDADLLLD